MGVRFGSALQWLALAGCGVILVLAGCGQFFPPLSSPPGGGSNSGDYLYVGNLAADNIGAFTFASSALTSISGSPFSGSIAPVAMAVTPSNSDLYVSSGNASGVGEIYLYPIDSDGAVGSGSLAGNVGPGALEADSTGNWLIGVDPVLGDAYVLQINSGGTLTQLTSSTVTLPNCTQTSMAGLNPGLAITSDDDYVYASCGTAGIYALSFDSGSGQLTYVGKLGPRNSTGADSGLAVATISGTSYLFAAETVTNGVRVFMINASSGQFTEVSGSPFSTGTGPDAVLVESTDTYVYVANRATSGTISGFTIGSGGALTAISGSPFATGSLPVALVEDNSHTYVTAICFGGNSDLETYTIGTGGALASFKNSATGSDPTEASSAAATQ